jgi:hypothetical protein
MNVEKEREDEQSPQVLAVGPLQAVAPRSFMLIGPFLLVLFHTPARGGGPVPAADAGLLPQLPPGPLLRLLKRARVPEAVAAALLPIVLVGKSVSASIP